MLLEALAPQIPGQSGYSVRCSVDAGAAERKD